MKLFIFVLVLIVTANVSAISTTIDIDWGWNWPGATDQDGYYLHTLDITQLLEDVERNGIDPFGTIGGDDVLVDSSWIGAGFLVLSGTFEHTTTGYEADANDLFYIWFFNADSINDATYYGNSPIIDIGLLDEVEEVKTTGIQTTIPIPEPSLLILGLLLIFKVLRK